MSRLLVTAHALADDLDRHRDRLAAADIQCHADVPPQAHDAAAMTRLLSTADVAIVGDDTIDAGALEANPHLKAVIKWGTGMDAIDLHAAERVGIVVRNTPDALAEAVAEGFFAYLLAFIRRIPAMDAGTRAGQWPKPRGESLHGQTLGLIGMGRIGQGIARLAAAFQMHVIATDVDPTARVESAHGPVSPSRLDEVLAGADIVSLCCNLTNENRHMIDAAALRRMKPSAVLVNVARGPLVDERALIAALTQGQIAGAILDVYEHEPLPAGHPLTGLDNVLMGSHNIQNTQRCVARTNEMAIRLAVEALA